MSEMGHNVSLSAPGGGEGRGEVGETRRGPATHLTRSLTLAPSPPASGRRGFNALGSHAATVRGGKESE